MRVIRHSTLLLAFLLLIVPASAQELLIRAGKVYTMTGAPLTPGEVRVSKGKIVEVGKKLSAPEGTTILDLGTGVLMPGLVDAYSNAGIAGNDAEATREITPGYRVLRAVDWRSRAFRAALADGTTSLGLDPGTDNVFAGLSSVVKTAGEQRIVQAETGVLITLASDPASGNSSRQRPDTIYVRQPTNRMGVVWMLRSTLDKASREESPELAVVREGLAGKRRIFAVSRTENDLVSLLRLAREFKFTPTVIGAQEAYKLRDELAAARFPVILGPLTSTSTGNGPESTELIWNQPGLLHKVGVPFALSGGQLLDQARFAVRYGLPAEVALEAITRTPARLLGIENRVGTVEVGRDADLLALNGDPLDLTTSIRWVLVDGKIYEKDN